jgi:hypothetical protein
VSSARSLEEGLNRRQFLAAAAAVSAFALVPRHVLGAGETPPSEKLNIAGIGVGGMGANNLENLNSQNIVALCDVDHEYAAKTFKQYPKARIWTDYREMLEKQRDIDAVVIATPDHTHTVIALAAMQAGKPAGSNFECAGLLTEICLLGNVAKRVGDPIHWDGVNMKITNQPEANRYVRTEYRKGWTL